jgi:EAL domain-containing protein (putative c-di-GMP-specific phosphodiesterase class I)
MSLNERICPLAESHIPEDATWPQPELPGSGVPLVREQAYEIIQAVLAGTDPEGEETRERLREHVAAHPGNPETALREHLVFTRSLTRHFNDRHTPRNLEADQPQEKDESGATSRDRAAVEAVLHEGRLVTAFQPIHDLAQKGVIAAEALTRFVWENGNDAGSWFRNAAAVGLGADLEFSALRSALAAVQDLPGHLLVALNISPVVCLDPRLPAILNDAPLEPSRIMLELTERIRPDRLASLLGTLTPLRRSGIGLAVDEAGPDAASMRSIRALKPDVIKIGRELVAGIDADPGRQYLVADLVEFGKQTGAALAAVGIETTAELAVLTRLAVDAGQGNLLGKPTLDVTEWKSWSSRSRRGTSTSARHRAWLGEGLPPHEIAAPR